MSSKDAHDPGWNDPPVFTYDKATAIQAAATKKGTLLNKRVAFPISGNLGNQNAQSNPVSNSLPKPPMSQLPPLSLPSGMNSEASTPLDSMTSKPPHEAGDNIGTVERLQVTLKNLNAVANCDDEIIKRINVMEKMWTDGKLGEEVKCRIHDLSESLVKGDMETVDHIQKSLMVDYVSQCSSWMSGIRQLINQKKNQE